ARLAARAALAADLQGKFASYQETLFAHQDALGRSDLQRYAQELGLDVARFSRDLDDARLDPVIDADLKDGDALQIKLTPTFFVKGWRVPGAQPLDASESMIARK